MVPTVQDVRKKGAEINKPRSRWSVLGTEWHLAGPRWLLAQVGWPRNSIKEWVTP